tara:strand:+ start:41865 stop:43298 length:1434 start_codon:yes stop_codon:yes gene_type:complete
VTLNKDNLIDLAKGICLLLFLFLNTNAYSQSKVLYLGNSDCAKCVSMVGGIYNSNNIKIGVSTSRTEYDIVVARSVIPNIKKEDFTLLSDKVIKGITATGYVILDIDTAGQLVGSYSVSDLFSTDKEADFYSPKESFNLPNSLNLGGGLAKVDEGSLYLLDSRLMTLKSILYYSDKVEWELKFSEDFGDSIYKSIYPERYSAFREMATELMAVFGAPYKLGNFTILNDGNIGLIFNITDFSSKRMDRVIFYLVISSSGKLISANEIDRTENMKRFFFISSAEGFRVFDDIIEIRAFHRDWNNKTLKRAIVRYQKEGEKFKFLEYVEDAPLPSKIFNLINDSYTFESGDYSDSIFYFNHAAEFYVLGSNGKYSSLILDSVAMSQITLDDQGYPIENYPVIYGSTKKGQLAYLYSYVKSSNTHTIYQYDLERNAYKETTIEFDSSGSNYSIYFQDGNCYRTLFDTKKLEVWDLSSLSYE